MVEALTELRAPYTDARKPRARDEHVEQVLAVKIEAIKARGKRAALRRR